MWPSVVPEFLAVATKLFQSIRHSLVFFPIALEQQQQLPFFSFNILPNQTRLSPPIFHKTSALFPVRV